MRIILLGMPLCGKTSVGKRLAKILDLKFIDTDTVFEQCNNIRISEFFKTHTEGEFRLLERQTLFSVIKEENCVISVGGGLPCFFDNMDLILQNFVSVYLYLAEGVILSRLKNNKCLRPLLLFDNDTDTMLNIHSLLQEREPFYNRANIKINSQGIDIKKLVVLIKEQESLASNK